MPDSFTETFAAGLAGYGNRPCLEFEERWFTGNEVTGYADAIAGKLHEAGVSEYAPVGVVVRNRLPHAAAIVGLLAARRWVSMIYSFQSPDAIGRDIEQLGLAAVVADREDWTAPVIAAATRTGSAGVASSLHEPTVELVAGLGRVDDTHQHPQSDGAAGLHVLTSGTTGPPKRQAINAPVLERTVFSVTGGQASPDDPPQLIYWPLGGIGGSVSLSPASTSASGWFCWRGSACRVGCAR